MEGSMASENLDDLMKAVVEMKFSEAGDITRKALESGTSAVDILDKALVPALDRVGVLFRDGDYFLPDVLMCVKAYENSYSLIEPALREGKHASRGKVLLGTVEGDIHEIGKNILAALLQGNGFEVVNIGANVKASVFVEKARENRPDVIGMSALLTTTMPAMREVIDAFRNEGMRDSFKFIVGGAPLNQAFADQIGADGYGEDAQSGVDLVKRLIG